MNTLRQLLIGMAALALGLAAAAGCERKLPPNAPGSEPGTEPPAQESPPPEQQYQPSSQ